MKNTRYAGWHENAGGIVQTNEWYTPPYIFERLNIKFNIDVSTVKGGLEWIPAEKHFDQEIDGLKQDWEGLVWCNPPYGRQTPIWLEKFIKHGNGIALLNARTDTIWYQEYATKSDIICFIKGRLTFYTHNKIPAKSPSGTGSMLIGCGNTAIKAIKEAKLGQIIVRNEENWIG